MALDSYSALKAAVAAWMHRSDLTDNLGDMVTLAEAMISADLSSHEVMTTTESGIILAQSASTFTLPVAARGLRTLRCTSPNVKHVGIRAYQDVIAQTLLDSSQTGAPRIAAIAGNNAVGTLTVQVYPTADQAYTLEATYPAGLVALSDSNASNFLLVRAPAIYFYATMHQAMLFTVDMEKAKLWYDKYQTALNDFLGQQWASAKLRTEIGAEGNFNIYTGA